MNCWDILSIEPTSDERTIRRAYAKQLKITRPDEDAEGYQQLRAAFDEALSIAPYYQEQEQEEWEWQDTTEDIAVLDVQQQSVVIELEQPPVAVDLAVSNLLDDVPNQDDVLLSFEHEPTLHAIEQTDEQSASTQDESAFAPTLLAVESTDEPASQQNMNIALTSVDQVLADIQQRFDQAGVQGLIADWGLIQAQLALLPLEDSDYASWSLLQFLKHNLIGNPYLWAQWSNYFHWHDDYQVDTFLSFDEQEQLREHLFIADLVSDSSFGVEEYPVAKKLMSQIAKGRHFLLNVFYTFLVYPFLLYEQPKGYRFLFDEYNFTFLKIHQRSKYLRILLRAYLMYILCFLPIQAEAGFSGQVLATSFLFLLMMGLFSIFAPMILLFAPKNQKFRLIVGVILPVVLLIPLYFQQLDSFIVQQPLLCFVIVCFLWGCVDNETGWQKFGYNLAAFGLFLLCGLKEVNAGLDAFLIMLALVWINSNLFLTQYYPAVYASLYDKMNTPFVPSPKKVTELPLLILNSLISMLLWFYLLPSLVGHWLARTHDRGSIFEIVVMTLFILASLSQFTDYALFLFYPVLLCIYLLQLSIKKVVFYLWDRR
ncbi:hypothetical protein ACFSAV_10525 [Pasteurella oralis]|uniref:J domain-containing protein n=1 Tax=Pasteurella oralis TaxID=1071947 RepID=A0ABW4NX82_9PAST